MIISDDGNNSSIPRQSVLVIGFEGQGHIVSRSAWPSSHYPCLGLRCMNSVQMTLVDVVVWCKQGVS